MDAKSFDLREVHIPPPVTAVQFDGSLKHAKEIVKWVYATGTYATSMNNSLRPDLSSVPVRLYVEYHPDLECVLVEPGEWVVHGENGFDILSDEKFQATYKEI